MKGMDVPGEDRITALKKLKTCFHFVRPAYPAGVTAGSWTKLSSDDPRLLCGEKVWGNNCLP